MPRSLFTAIVLSLGTSCSVPQEATQPDTPIAPTAVPGRYLCGDEWLELDDANDFHSRTLHWWEIPSEHFVAYSTCSRRTTEVALEWMNHIYPELTRVFGQPPPAPPTVILLRSQEQYNAFAVTQAEIGELPPDSQGYAAFHYAFPCDQWLDKDRDYEYPGAACAYWDDRTAAGNGWGPYAVRHAAAQAFAEALDPSPVAIANFQEQPEGTFPTATFWSEKKLPLWFRYGAAMYCERFLVQPSAADPFETRSWSLAALDELGGPVDLDALFAFELDPTDVRGAQHLLLSSGALVAFLMDGEQRTLEAPLARLQKTLQESFPKDEARLAARGLEDELRAARSQWNDFVEAGR